MNVLVYFANTKILPTLLYIANTKLQCQNNCVLPIVNIRVYIANIQTIVITVTAVLHANSKRPSPHTGCCLCC